MPRWTKTDGEDEEKQAIRNKNVFYFIIDFIRIIKCNQKKKKRVKMTYMKSVNLLTSYNKLGTRDLY